MKTFNVAILYFDGSRNSKEWDQVVRARSRDVALRIAYGDLLMTHPAADIQHTACSEIDETEENEMPETPSTTHFSDKVVFKDEFGDSVSFHVDEGDDGDYDNKFYMIAHDGDTNESIDFLFTREQFGALIKFMAEHVVADESLDEGRESTRWSDEVLNIEMNDLNNRLMILEMRLRELERKQ
jgi:hypothetical protein